MSTLERVLIAGCGDLGTAVGLALAARGCEVFGVRRRAGLLPAPLRPIAADLATGEGLDALPTDVGLVIIAIAADGSSDARYRAAYVDAPRVLLQSLVSRGNRPRRVLLVSSTSVHGQDAGEFVDETSATESRNFAGELILEGERLVAAGPFPATILRLAGIYGPGRTRLIDSVREGRARVRPGGPHWTNRIHRDDAAAALVHLAGLAALEPVYLGVDREPADEADVLRYLATLLRMPPPPSATEGGGAEQAGSLHRSAGAGKRCSSARLVASGFRHAYPTYREGYAALVARPA